MSFTDDLMYLVHLPESEWPVIEVPDSSGSKENGNLIELKKIGEGTFGVVYLHTGVRSLIYIPTPGHISYHSSLES